MTDNQSINDLTKAIELNPQDKEAYFNRANAYIDLEKYQEAIADYTKAIELDPEYHKACHNRGNKLRRI
jgi:tetratricopeptide (TPR) repeat protein